MGLWSQHISCNKIYNSGGDCALTCNKCFLPYATYLRDLWECRGCNSNPKSWFSKRQKLITCLGADLGVCICTICSTLEHPQFSKVYGDSMVLGEGLVTRACVDRIRGNGFKLKDCRYTWDSGRNSLLWESNTGTGYLEELWMLHSWKCSRPRWMELRAAWSSGMCSCLREGGWNQVICKSFPIQTIVWFCYLGRHLNTYGQQLI